MKKFSFSLLFCTIVVFLTATTQDFGQQSDTLIVAALPPGNLNTVISSDTLSDGSRNPNRVYLLQQTGPEDTVYFMTARVDSDFPLTIIGKKNPVTGKLPVIANFPNISGNAPSLLFREIGVGGSVYFKDLYFCMWRTDSVANCRLLNPKADSLKVTLDHVVLDGNQANAFLIQSSYLNVHITNCMFRDIRNSNNNGSIVGVNGNRDIDTCVMVNNTFYGAASFGDGGYIGYLYYDHNTSFMSQNSPFSFPELSNGIITNNIFFGVCAQGIDSAAIKSTTADIPGNGAVIRLDSLRLTANEPHFLKETDRNITLKNNAYFWPQELIDYWNAVTDTTSVPGLVTPPIYLSPMATKMFDDNTTWSKVVKSDNVEVDPGFNSELVSTSVAAMVKYVNALWFEKTAGELRTIPNPTLTPLAAEANLSPNWSDTQGYPVPENLKYTANLIGNDGYPLGDLNWFPGVQPVSVEQISDLIPTEFELSQNYPNPFNPTTNIKYSITKSGFVTLRVFNILGQEVATLVNRFQKAGSYKVDFNALQFASGVYMYRLEANGFSQTKKMLLMK